MRVKWAQTVDRLTYVCAQRSVFIALGRASVRQATAVPQLCSLSYFVEMKRIQHALSETRKTLVRSSDNVTTLVPVGQSRSGSIKSNPSMIFSFHQITNDRISERCGASLLHSSEHIDGGGILNFGREVLNMRREQGNASQQWHCIFLERNRWSSAQFLSGVSACVTCDLRSGASMTLLVLVGHHRKRAPPPER